SQGLRPLAPWNVLSGLLRRRDLVLMHIVPQALRGVHDEMLRMLTGADAPPPGSGRLPAGLARALVPVRRMLPAATTAGGSRAVSGMLSFGGLGPGWLSSLFAPAVITRALLFGGTSALPPLIKDIGLLHSVGDGAVEVRLYNVKPWKWYSAGLGSETVRPA